MSHEQVTPEEIFNAARTIADQAQRDSYLRSACGSDLNLRGRIDALLKADAEAGSFLADAKEVQSAGSGNSGEMADDDATVAHRGSGPSRRLTETPGAQIGPYRLLERIGEGGMGEVWVAEQREPVRRKVALKIVKAGMDTREVLVRFEAERQALALMDHPGVAKVFDAGATESGRPYFVMEYVAGLPINEHCDTTHLKISERMALFIEVCQVVQHAHQKGIIHRDLKPSNVLVTLQDGKPAPKVIDFGIAKATLGRLTDRTLYTEMGKLIGTPEYMSPEQTGASGLDVDTRADIYSLGVILYELLTGTLPFDPKTLRHAGFDAMAKIIRELEPPKPSTRLSTLAEEAVNRWEGKTPEEIARGHDTDFRTLRREVRGDLDWITMKCLEKERSRRYDTANGLAMEIQRYLHHEPVLAGPPSAIYRLKKFSRRNRSPVAAGIVVTLVLVGGVVGTSYGLAGAIHAREAEAEQRRFAEQSERKALDARDEAEQVTQFLTDTLAAVDPAEQGRDVSVREVLDRAADQVAKKFAGKPLIEARIRLTVAVTYHGLGLYDRAEVHAAESAAIYRRHLGERDRRTLGAMSTLADAVGHRGEYGAMEAQFRAVLEIQRRVLGEEHPETLRSVNSLAASLERQGRHAEAEAMFRQTLEIQRRVLGDEHRESLGSMHNLAMSLGGQGRHAEAEALQRQTLEIQRRVLGEEHPETLVSMSNLATSLYRQGRYAEAEALYRQTLEIRTRVLGEEHPETPSSIHGLAITLYHQGRYAEAEALFRQTLEIQRRVLGEEHPDTLRAMSALATSIHGQGRFAEMEELLRKTLEICRRTLGDEHPQTLMDLHNLANSLQGQGRHAEAEKFYRQSEEIQRRVLGEEHPSTLLSMCNLANNLRSQDRYAEAEVLHRKTLAIQRRVLSEEHPDTLLSMSSLAISLDKLGRYPEAEELHRQTVEIERRVEGEEHPHTLSSVNGLASGLYEQGRYAEAEELYRQTLEIRRRVSGEEHPVTLRSMYNLAISLDALGRYADAEALYRQTLGVHRRVLGEEHPETPDSMRGLADVLSAQGKTEEARPLTEQLIALRRKRAEGAEATPADLDAYAGLLLACEPEDQRDPSAALPFAEKAVEQTGGKNLDFLGTLALACHNTGNTDRAVEMQRKALDLLPSDQTPKRVALEGRLGQYLTAQGEAIRRALPKDAPRTEQARECFAEAETLLLGAHQALTAREYVPPKELKESLDRLMKLYDSWDTAEPGKGYAAKAEEYRALLEAKPEDAAEK